MPMTAKMSNKGDLVKRAEGIIKSFNPVTHSIDTHCSETLGDYSMETGSPENVFIQQIVYGWHREKRILDAFNKNFYDDNAARLLRQDKVMYAILAYLAVYRMDELGARNFKEICQAYDPMKVYFFISYLFNNENLWGKLHDDWLKVLDVKFVEDELIASVEGAMPDLASFCAELEARAVGAAQAAAEKEAFKKSGKAGLAQVEQNELTRPISPNITKPAPRPVEVPEMISTTIIAHEIPAYLAENSVADVAEMRAKRLEETKQKTLAKYSDAYHFQLGETRHGKPLDELKREVEEERLKEVNFNASFVNPPPDFKKIPAKVRANAASVLREEYLFRKQQAKDVKLLKAYESELRDPTEFYAWQSEMKEKDEKVKLAEVVSRRYAAKKSSEDAQAAIDKQREDNHLIARLMRDKGDAIMESRTLEKEISKLEHREKAVKLVEDHEKNIKAAKEKVVSRVAKQRKTLIEQLEDARIQKQEEDRLEEERKADRIRQLRAENEVHKVHVKVFDPTETAHVGVLDEMSFMEMKTRLALNRQREAEAEVAKRGNILQGKQKKADKMEDRVRNIARARQIKAEATSALALAKREADARAAAEAEKIRSVAAVVLDEKLTTKRVNRQNELEALRVEEERIRRQQQYLGAASGLVEETRARNQLLGLERETKVSQVKTKEEVVKMEKALQTDRHNRTSVTKHNRIAHAKEIQHKDSVAKAEKFDSIAKTKSDFLAKKNMVTLGRLQHERTKLAMHEYNPYATAISQEIHQNTLSTRNRMKGSQRGYT
jgi:hypothetical protein